MAAPILKKGKLDREVYFTTVGWFNIHSFDHYEAGTHTISDVKLTDKIPLFIK